MTTIPPIPVWDDDGATIDMLAPDQIVSNTLENWGIEIDWSANETAETVGTQIGPGEAVEYHEIYGLLRDVAFAAYQAGRNDTDSPDVNH